ncbi:class I SAM-dependent RNA methyltransferase [Candidatus Saccharibacteria bacterium]|nr:class I SAM-dependent RNA methyltransferase [Candidatus Saccharibacteria bacterium]
MAKVLSIISDQPVKIDRLVPGGQGIGTREDGIKGFFWNALPGEIVSEYYITKKKSHYFEAIAIMVENASPHRVIPKDECFLSTSPWQIMDYEYELEQKSELLAEIFRQNGLECLFCGPFLAMGQKRWVNTRDDGMATHCPQRGIQTVLTDNYDFYYRNKMEYALYWDIAEEKIKLAFHMRGSHRKVPIDRSSIERPEIFEEALRIVEKLNRDHEEARKYQSLLLRCNQNGKVSGGLFENRKPHPHFDNLEDVILGQKYSYSPNGFFQINIPVYEMALKEIAKHIKTEKVLDLYAGVGTIGLSVARDKNLTLVENNKAAYEELRRNCYSAISESIPQAILSNSEDALSYIESNQTVILDPPRAGCEKKLLEKLLEIKPKTIVYLSCNPTTQARDVKILTEKYHITNITPFNFFPRTPHLENLVILNISPDE